MRLVNKICIITGASNGMGAAEAKLFAKEGAHVILCDIQDELGKSLATDINESGFLAHYVHLDVTKEDQWESLISFITKEFGRLDVLVNNAGISSSGPDFLDTEQFDKVMHVNSKSVFLGMKSVIPLMVKQQKGSIVNISSVSGMIGQTFVAMGYSGSKAAVRLMTKSVAIQYAPNGIRANSVHPGVMPPMTTSQGTADPEVRKGMIASVPMGRAGLIEEVANAVLFLASDESSYITGVELPVDGGQTAK
jgi:NAD(P)-dependent dehydrogenase (short-subunit alcohol dehydrogenase family)